MLPRCLVRTFPRFMSSSLQPPDESHLGRMTSTSFSPCMAPVSARSFWFKSYTPPGQEHFGFHEDTYGGVVIDLNHQEGTTTFSNHMRATLDLVTSLGFKKGVWLKVSKANASIIPCAISEFGFDFHHAEGSISSVSSTTNQPANPEHSPSYLMLSKWLPGESMECTLPSNASHTVGVAAVVLHKGRVSTGLATGDPPLIALVKESTGPAARLGIWKLPTGRVETGEGLIEAAVREAGEELGLEGVKGIGLLSLREGHGGVEYLGGKSDLMAVVVCETAERPVTNSGPPSLNPREGEIADAQWVPADRVIQFCGFKDGSASRHLMEIVADYAMGVRDGVWKPKVVPTWREGENHVYYCK